MEKKLKTFYTAGHSQLNYNNIVTAIEFMYPDTLESFAGGNKTKHFNTWKSISTLACIEFSKGFNGNAFMKIIGAFESQYNVKNKAEVLSCNYSSVDELFAHCVENDLGIVTANDFLFPKGGVMQSLNKKEFSGVAFLVKQV